ncbi:hypothetical protein RCL1_003523 [Eukaryota sp. TZLM3-RCL]
MSDSEELFTNCKPVVTLTSDGPFFDYSNTRFKNVKHRHLNRVKRKVYMPYPMPSFDRPGVQFIVGFYKIDRILKKWVLVVSSPVSLTIVHSDRLMSGFLVFVNNSSNKLVLRLPITSSLSFTHKNNHFLHFSCGESDPFGINFSSEFDAQFFLYNLEEIRVKMQFAQKVTRNEGSFLPQPILASLRTRPVLHHIPRITNPKNITSDKVTIDMIENSLRRKEKELSVFANGIISELNMKEVVLVERLKLEISQVVNETLEDIDHEIGTNLANSDDF